MFGNNLGEVFPIMRKKLNLLLLKDHSQMIKHTVERKMMLLICFMDLHYNNCFI